MANINAKKYISLVVLLFISVVAMAQYEKTTVKDRLGSGREGEKNLTIYNQYVEAYTKQNWKDCYRPWRELMDRAPYCTFNLSYYGSGGYVIRELIKQEPDSIHKYMYFKDLMRMMDFAIKNYKSLNSVEPEQHKNVTYTKSKLLCWKAHFYYEEGKNIPEKAYKKDVAYQNYVDAFKELRSQNLVADAQNDMEIINYMTEYYKTCEDLYLTDKDKYLEQFLTDYVSCLETCDKMMGLYQESDSMLYAYAAAVRNNVQVFFQQTGAGATDNLVKFYTPRVQENKKNIDFLNNAVHLMFANNCIGEEVFYDACEAANMIKPNYENCIGMGLLTLNVEEDRDAAKEYFDKARGLAQTANEHYLASKFTADAVGKTPQPQRNDGEDNASLNARLEQWRNLLRGALIYYNEALDYAQQAAIQGQYLSEVYYSMADCYRKTLDYVPAKECLQQTKVCYALFSDERYNSMEAAIQSGLQRKEESDARMRAQLKAKAQWDAYNARLAEAERKRKAEEAFWKGGK